MEPSNITFLRNRGNCRRLQGSFAGAVEDFDRYCPLPSLDHATREGPTHDDMNTSYLNRPEMVLQSFILERP